MFKKLLILLFAFFILISVVSLITFADDVSNHEHNFQNGFCITCNERHNCIFQGATIYEPGVCICGFSEADYILSRPETNLEFWINDTVDISTLNLSHGFYPISLEQYYNLKYGWPTRDDRGEGVHPKVIVKYRILDDSTKPNVKEIVIMDPDIYLDNISINSTMEEFKEWAKNSGLTFIYQLDNSCEFQTGLYNVRFVKDKQISIKYTDRYSPSQKLVVEDVDTYNINVLDIMLVIFIVLGIVEIVLFVKTKRNKHIIIICVFSFIILLALLSTLLCPLSLLVNSYELTRLKLCF